MKKKDPRSLANRSRLACLARKEWNENYVRSSLLFIKCVSDTYIRNVIFNGLEFGRLFVKLLSNLSRVTYLHLQRAKAMFALDSNDFFVRTRQRRFSYLKEKTCPDKFRFPRNVSRQRASPLSRKREINSLLFQTCYERIRIRPR